MALKTPKYRNTEAGCWSLVEVGPPNNRNDVRDRSISEIVIFDMFVMSRCFFQKRRFECPVHFFLSCVCASDVRGGILGN